MSAIEPGVVFANRFEIEREAGCGGMGAVYRARDRYTHTWVALKLMHEGGAQSGSERFAREAQVLAALSHPGIVAYVAHGATPGGRLFLAMEWLDGEDLADRLTRGALPLGECVVLMQRVAEALEVAHRQGVVHRDLKPSNLFLVDGVVARAKVLDFGIARRMTTSQAMTRTGALIGTPDYMAPEQARGARSLTPAADVFSLGCVLYECLTGRPPFVAEHLAAVLARILLEDPPPVEDLRPDVPGPLSALLRRMLAKQPEQRLADAGALGAALSALGELPGDGVAPARAPRLRPSSSFAEREQGLFSLVMASPPLPLDEAATIAEDEAHADDARQSTIRRALAAMELSADFVAGGSLVVKVLGAGSATDQAAHAARAALLVKELWPLAQVALATGPGAVEGPFTVGEVADRAVRLLTQPAQAAPESHVGVRLDRLSARLLAPRFALTPSPDGALLTGQEHDADTSWRLLGKPTPCVGREAELGSLEAQLTGCIEALEARAVLVTAPPGAGKSRLLHELLRRIDRHGEPVAQLAGRGEARSAGAPYGILAAAIRALAGVSGGEPLEEQRRLLRARVGEHVAAAERERVVCFVGEICTIPFPDEGMPMLQTARQEPKIMGDCLRRAALDWLAAECAAGPLLLVLDDLHWGDALTISVVDEALREQAGTALFVLALGRPEVHEAFPRLWHGHKVQEIVLRGLSRKACERLIREVLGKDVPPAAIHHAVDQSAGNALFLSELIRAIAEGTAEDQPETIVAMLQARIGRLGAGPRRALRAAAVFGQTFWTGGVAAVLGVSGMPTEITGWLATLIEAELIQPSPTSRLPGESEHSFQHALMRDAAYGLLTANDLATGHRLAGEFLEAAGEHDAGIIAGHIERGGDPKRAAGFYLRAAEESLERGDYVGARRLVARGEGCAPEGEVLGRLKSVVCYSGIYLNSYEGVSDATRSALELLRPGSVGWCRAFMGAVLADSEDSARLFALLSLVLESEPEPDAHVAYIEVECNLCSLMAAGAPEPMVQAYLVRLTSHVELASAALPAVLRYLLFARGYITLARSPQPWSALTDLGQAVRLAVEVGDRKIELVAKTYLTELGWLEIGDFDGACRRMLALEERISQSQDVLLFTIWASYLARILCEAPEEHAWARAEALMVQVLANTNGVLLLALGAQGILARVALVRGQIAKAEELARASMEILLIAPNVWLIHAPLNIHVRIGLGRAAEACLVAEQVTSTLQMIGGGCVEVEARLAVVEAFEASGDRGRARVELAETLRQIKLREDDITDPIWRESFLTKNPYCVRALALGRAWGVVASDSA